MDQMILEHVSNVEEELERDWQWYAKMNRRTMKKDELQIAVIDWLDAMSK